jgi:glycosyltransferase involved in cell wall biosynthesis
MQTELCVIVPLTRMSGRLNELSIWLRTLPQRELKVVLVHDIQDECTSPELNGLIKSCGDNRIILFEGNFGSPGIARNFGLSHSESTWVIFVDSDDVVNLKEVFSILDLHNEESSVLVGQYEVCDRVTGSIVKNKPNKNAKLDIAINPGIWRMIFLRERIRGHDFSDSLMGEDQLFLLQIGVFGEKIQFFDNVIYRYFKNSSHQLTGRRDAIIQINSIIPKTYEYFMKLDNSQRQYASMMLLRQLVTKSKNIEKAGFQNRFLVFCSLIYQFGPASYVYLFKSIIQLSKHKVLNG